MSSVRIGEPSSLREARPPTTLRGRSGALGFLASPIGILIVFPSIVACVGTALTLNGLSALRESNLAQARARMDDQVELMTTHVAEALTQAEPLLDELKGEITSGTPETEPTRMAKLLRRLLRGRAGISYISVSFPDGTFQGAYLDAPNGDGTPRLLFQESRVEATGTVRREFAFGTQNQLIVERTTKTDYDPRTRPFYELAVEHDGRVWTEPYTFYDSHFTGVTRTEAVYDAAVGENRRLLAVLTVDFDVHAISALLAKSALPFASTLLFRADGTILGYPRVEGKGTTAAKSDRLLHFRDLDDPNLNEFFRLRSTSHEKVQELVVNGEPLLASEQMVGTDPHLKWYVAQIVPEQAFLGKLAAYSRKSLLVATVALSLAVALSAWFARLIVRARKEADDARDDAKKARARARELGSYRLIECLGKGGMGEVWRAEHRLLARESAIKLIRHEEGSAPTPLAQERFRREAQSLASLRCRNTIELYDYGVTEDGTFYYVMELLDGLDLESLVTREGIQPVGRVVEFLKQAARSLGEAHRAGLVHRDIKPANLYVCRIADDLDVIKVLDFGLVRTASFETTPDAFSENPEPPSEPPISAKLTRAEHIMGTPEYIAPEQAAGEEVDGRADLYALGCVAFWLLAGRSPFAGRGLMPTIMAHLQEAPAKFQDIAAEPLPPALADVLNACLAKSPADRPSSAEEFYQALSRIELAPEQLWTDEKKLAFWSTFQAPRLVEVDESFEKTTEVPVDPRSQTVLLAADDGRRRFRGN